MKKILSQIYIDESLVEQPIVVYTVPIGEQTVIESIYISSVITGTNDEMEYNYTIRIVKNWDIIDPNTAWDSKAMANEMYKNAIVMKPKRKTQDFPDIYTNIVMWEWDSIVLHSSLAGITINVFGEELTYDADDIAEMQRDATLQWANQISTAIANHQTQYTCECSCG